MARYNKPTSDGPSSEEKALDLFAEMMIEKIQSIDKDWKKPWFTDGALQWPKNLNGRDYNGMNALMLLIQCEKQGWKIPRFCTFDCVQRLNNTEKKDANGEALPRVSVLKGERAFPVFITTFTCVDKDTRERIKYDDYRQLYFNSIKVRLELDGNCLNSASPSFQFHKGTIRTSAPVPPCHLTLISIP